MTREHRSMPRKFCHKKMEFLLMFLFLAALGAQGCLGFRTVVGTGEVVQATREVQDFQAVELVGIGNLYIKLGEKEDLLIEAEDNLIRYFETDIENGVLTIRTEENVILRPRKPVKFYLTVRELEKIEVAGSGTVQVPDFTAEKLFVGIRGSGEVKMEDLTAESLNAEISGSGGLELGDLDSKELKVNITGSGGADIAGGKVSELRVSISGSGEYQAGNTESANAEVQVTGSGEAIIKARDHLKINISGSGNVSYAGDPALEETVSGSGKVQRLSE